MHLYQAWLHELQTFNRTIVELKRRSHQSRSECHHAFNRTIVELKLTIPAQAIDPVVTFNRTIVELKHVQ